MLAPNTTKFNRKKTLVGGLYLSLATCLAAQIVTNLTRLADPATTDIARKELLQKAHSNRKAEIELAETLPSMLSHAPDDVVIRSEAKLAGELKIEAAIPALVQLLSHPDWQAAVGGLSWTHELRGDAVARALYEMGPVAYPALAGALNSGDKEKRTRAISVLVLADTPESRKILRLHQAKEPDARLREYIQGNLDIPLSNK